MDPKFALLLGEVLRPSASLSPAAEMRALRASTARRHLSIASVTEMQRCLYGPELEKLADRLVNHPLRRRHLRRLVLSRRRILADYLDGDRSYADARRALVSRFEEKCVGTRDDSPVLFGVSGCVTSSAERRFLLGHYVEPRTAFHLEEWDESPGLVVAPRWAHQVIALQAGGIVPAPRSRGKGVTQGFPLVGVDVAAVVSLWEPDATGPLSCLGETLTAAALLC